MDLSDRTMLFPERPWFAEWREKLDVKAVIFDCTHWSERLDKLVKKPGEERKLEALYEFLAAQGKLAEFDHAWRQIEDDYKQGYHRQAW